VWAFWCTDEPRANTDSQNSPQPKLGGSHHLPPYSILFVWPQDQHPNVILFRDSQIGVPKFSKLSLPQLWGAHNFVWKPLIEMRSKKSCNPRWDLFSGMLHTTYTQGNQGNSRLLMVRSQICQFDSWHFFWP